MSSIEEEARRVGHPNPEKATWGEVNVLSVAVLKDGRVPSKAEASRFLEQCERSADFSDLFRE